MSDFLEPVSGGEPANKDRVLILANVRDAVLAEAERNIQTFEGEQRTKEVFSMTGARVSAMNEWSRASLKLRRDLSAEEIIVLMPDAKRWHARLLAKGLIQGALGIGAWFAPVAISSWFALTTHFGFGVAAGGIGIVQLVIMIFAFDRGFYSNPVRKFSLKVFKGKILEPLRFLKDGYYDVANWHWDGKFSDEDRKVLMEHFYPDTQR